MKHSRIRCRTARNLLPLHVGNDLERGRARAVDEHLSGCLVCFREFRELSLMRQRLGALAEEPLPVGVLDGFTEEVMARVAVGESGPAADPPRSARRWPLATRLAAAAALLLAVTFGLDSVRHLVTPADEAGVPAGRPDLAASEVQRTLRPSLRLGPVEGTPVGGPGRLGGQRFVFGELPGATGHIVPVPVSFEPEPDRELRPRVPVYRPR